MEIIDLSKKSIIEIKTQYRDNEAIDNILALEFDDDLELSLNVQQVAALENVLRRFQEAFYGFKALASTRTVDSS